MTDNKEQPTRYEMEYGINEWKTVIEAADYDAKCTAHDQIVEGLKAQLAEARAQIDEDGAAFISRVQMGLEAVERLTAKLAEQTTRAERLEELVDEMFAWLAPTISTIQKTSFRSRAVALSTPQDSQQQSGPTKEQL